MSLKAARRDYVKVLTTLTRIRSSVENEAFAEVFSDLEKVVDSCYGGEVDNSFLTTAVYMVFRGVLSSGHSDLMEGLFLLCLDHPALAGAAFHMRCHLEDIDAGVKTVQQYVDFFGEMHTAYMLVLEGAYDQAVERVLNSIDQGAHVLYESSEFYLVLALRRWLYAINSRYSLHKFRLQLGRAQALMIHRMSLWEAMHDLCLSIEEILEECPPGYHPGLLPLSNQRFD